MFGNRLYPTVSVKGLHEVYGCRPLSTTDLLFFPASFSSHTFPVV